MKVLIVLSAALLGACAGTHPLVSHQTDSIEMTDEANQALLLVSLSDGQLVLQHIDVDADVCMKSNDGPETRCFKRGAPIYDTDSSAIIAYQLEPRELSLHAR